MADHRSLVSNRPDGNRGSIAVLLQQRGEQKDVEISEAEEEDESPPPPHSAQMQAQMWGRAQPQSFQPPEPTASPDLMTRCSTYWEQVSLQKPPSSGHPGGLTPRRPGVATRTTITG